MLAYHNNKNRYIELMMVHKRNNCCYEIVLRVGTSLPTFTCSKSTTDTLEKGVKYVQS